MLMSLGQEGSPVEVSITVYLKKPLHENSVGVVHNFPDFYDES